MNHNTLLDAGMSAVATGATQVSAGYDPSDNPWPIIVGIMAPIIKEALFKLIDKIGTLHRERKAKRNAKGDQ